MRIALIRPRMQFSRYVRRIPLSYIHLAAYLREKGHEPLLLDMVLDYLNEEEVDRRLRERGIRVAGIGCMTFEYPESLKEAERLKAAHPGITIIFGGAHPSGAPEECLESGVVDYVVVGEGEIALTQLLQNLESGKRDEPVQGVWRKAGSTIVPSQPAPAPDVNLLPVPAYDLLDLEAYFKIDSPWYFTNSRRAVQFITSRGCPYQCAYCHSVHGKRFRGQTPSKVLGQMEHLAHDFGIEEFIIIDDVFNFDLERAKDICREIIIRNLKVHLQFPNGVRGDRFDEELIALMKKAGTHFMAVAIETASPKFQRLIGKNLNIRKAMQTLHWARQHGIEVSGYFMIGFPGETLEEVKETVDFAVNAPFNAIFLSFVAAFKGTAMREDLMKGRFGKIQSDGIRELNERIPLVHSETLTPEMLRKLQLNAYWRFYTKPRAIGTILRRLACPRNMNKMLRAIFGRIHQREQVSVN